MSTRLSRLMSPSKTIEVGLPVLGLTPPPTSGKDTVTGALGDRSPLVVPVHVVVKGELAPTAEQVPVTAPIVVMRVMDGELLGCVFAGPVEVKLYEPEPVLIHCPT